MKRILLIFAALLWLAAGALTLREWLRYKAVDPVFPRGSKVGPIEAGGLTVGETVARLESVLAAPVELVYQGERIHAAPQQLGFQLQADRIESSLAEAPGKDFWDFLWNKVPEPLEIPLAAAQDDARVRSYLAEEIQLRYDQPPARGMPSDDGLGFSGGAPGHVLDMDAAVAPVQAALRSVDQRTVNLPVLQVPAQRPEIGMLEFLLRQTVLRSGFDGTAELYLNDLSTGEQIHFALHEGSDIPPGVAFTAASTIKIPIAVSALRRYGEPLPAEVVNDLRGMFLLSDNPSADRLMARLDAVNGPLLVSEDAARLGLKNSFLAGYFAPGAPLLKLYTTPANSRADINLQPDVYNQTTPDEIGLLLEELYRCARDEPNLLGETFPGEITAGECGQVIDILSQNKNGLLVEAGLPEGTWLAHKHGWIEEADGLLHTVSDVSLVQTPGGDYVLTVYLHTEEQLLFNAANHLVAELAHISYNYFNLDQQAPWPFGPAQYRP